MPQHIYFLQEPTSGAIKIGISLNVGKRIAQLEQSLPYSLKLVGLIEGDYKTETELHARFQKHRIKGEWFKADEEILKFIKETNKDQFDAPGHHEQVGECRALLELSVPPAPMEDEFVSIEKAANLLGVSTATLRNWDQNGKFSPTRTSGKHRRYSLRSINNLKKQMMMGAEFLLPMVKTKDLLESITASLNYFEPEEKISVSIVHDTFADKVRVTISSEDGLSCIKKSFITQE